MMMMCYGWTLLLFVVALAVTTTTTPVVDAFSSSTSSYLFPRTTTTITQRSRGISSSTSRLFSSAPSDVTSAGDQTLEELKSDLVSICTRSNKPTLDEVKDVVRELEDKAEQVSK